MKKIPLPVYYLLAAALLGGYIFFFERGPVKSDADKDKDKTKKVQVFANYVADDIKGIKLENLATTVNADKAPIVIEKDANDVWQIVEPRHYKADETTIRSMLTAAGDFNPESTIENATNLAEFGLNTPTARASFTSKSGTVFTLLAGVKNVTGSSTYIKTPFKNDVYMVQAYVIDNLSKSVNDYRDKTFFKTDEVLAQKIKVTKGSKVTVFEKGKDGVWNMTEPIKTKADEQRVKDLLNAVSNLRVVSYPDDHPANLGIYGLSNPSASIEVWSASSKEPDVVLLGREKLKANQYFAKAGNLPFVFLVNDYFSKTLDIDISNYRDKSMMKFDSPQAKTLTVKHRGKSYVYQKNDQGQWVSDGRTKAQEEASYIINVLSNTVITDFASKKDATGLKNPSYVVEVVMNSGEKRTYRFGGIQKTNVFLASDKNKDVYLVPSNLIAQLDSYYSAILTPVPVTSPVSK